MGRGKRKKKGGPSIADRADRHALYQKAVQTPEADVDFFTDTFAKIRNRRPMSLREDFCGTAYFAATWCQSHPERTVIAIDLDGPTLDWGREHNLEPAGDDVARRVELREANVLDPPDSRVDLTCAMNFSFGVFKTRSELLAYFRNVLAGLNDDGVFFTELYGGTEGIADDVSEDRGVDGFEYVWEQEKYNPINHHTLCYIHFRFKDGSRINRAFTYDWRLWSIPEIRELMEEAGFSKTVVYWEECDEDGDGNGNFIPTEEEEQQESWLCYLVAQK